MSQFFLRLVFLRRAKIRLLVWHHVRVGPIIVFVDYDVVIDFEEIMLGHLGRLDLSILVEALDLLVGLVHHLELILGVWLEFVVVDQFLDIFDHSLIHAILHHPLHRKQEVGLLVGVVKIYEVEQVLYQLVGHLRVVLG